MGLATGSELQAVMDVVELGFSTRLSEGERQATLEVLKPELAVVSRDDGEVVATANSADSEMTLPGGIVEPVAAVVGVAVRPTHRRQGRLRQMMRYQLDDIRQRGHHTAVLTASESRIYQRFGYGPATLVSDYRFEKRDLSVEWGGEVSGKLRLLDGKEAFDLLPAVLRSYQASRHGEVGRLPLAWRYTAGQIPGETDDRYYVAYEEPGGLLGYAIYKIERDPGSEAKRRLNLLELCTRSQDAYLALWRYLIDIDLVDSLQADTRPIDEPIRWALSDYRRMRTYGSSEHTYVRLIDVETALRRRRYERAGAVSFQLADPFCPWNEGIYRLSVGDDGTAETERLRAGDPDASFDASTLGSLYLGGLSAPSLADAGLIEVHRPEALEALGRLFGTLRPPFCTTSF